MGYTVHVEVYSYDSLFSAYTNWCLWVSFAGVIVVEIVHSEQLSSPGTRGKIFANTIITNTLLNLGHFLLLCRYAS